MVQYCIGFLINKSFSRIVLIKKNRPDWQAGFYSVPGGHIEDNETPHEAVVREFREETGVQIDDWIKFCIITTDNFILHAYTHICDDDVLDSVRTTTDEEVDIFFLQDVLQYRLNLVSKIGWLVSMVSCHEIESWPFDIHQRV